MRSTSCKARWAVVCADRIGGRRPHALRMITGPMCALPVLPVGADAASRMLLSSVRSYVLLTSASDAAAGSMVKSRCAPGAGLRECVSGSSMPPNSASTHSTDALSAATDSWCGWMAAGILAERDGAPGPNGSTSPRCRFTPKFPDKRGRTTSRSSSCSCRSPAQVSADRSRGRAHRASTVPQPRRLRRGRHARRGRARGRASR